MASPTTAELETQLKNAVDVLEGYLSVQTVDTDTDTYVASIESDFALEQASGAASFRAAAAAVIGRASDLLTPVLQAYCHHTVGTPERNAAACLSRMYRYFRDNNKHVLSRAPTFATPSAAAGNTGTGAIRRLTTDERGYAIEACHADAKVARCISTAATGATKHEELFEVRGANADVDLLSIGSGSGSGLVRRGGLYRSVSPRDSLLLNAHFASYSIAGTLTTTYTLVSGDTISNWTINDVTQVTLDAQAGNLYRDTPGVTTPVTIVLGGNVTLTQTFEASNIQVDPNTPYDRALVWMRETSADGTLSLAVGSKTVSVDVTTGVNGSWNVLRPTLNEDLWPLNWDENDCDAVVELASNTTGTVRIAEVLLHPMWLFDGSWYLIHGGATPFRLNDEFTWTDSIASDSKIQKWLWIAFGRYLPHVANATQVTASGGRTLTFADSGSADTITASSGSFVTDGYVAGMTLTVAGTTSNNGTYTIATVTATVITVSSTDALTNEGPLSATATLDATPSITDP